MFRRRKLKNADIHVYLSSEWRESECELKLAVYSPKCNQLYEYQMKNIDKPDEIDLSALEYLFRLHNDFQTTHGEKFRIAFDTATGSLEFYEAVNNIRYGKCPMRQSLSQEMAMDGWLQQAVDEYERKQREQAGLEQELRELREITEKQKKLIDIQCEKRQEELQELYQNFLKLLNEKKAEIQRLRLEPSNYKKQRVAAYTEPPRIKCEEPQEIKGGRAAASAFKDAPTQAQHVTIEDIAGNDYDSDDQIPML